jgi:mRNA-degrading endonuclease toxin of MazEF toxin-antitoxin module
MVTRDTPIPDSGDIAWIGLDPALGHEQKGRRPVLVLSPASYNRKAGLAICCPVTGQVKGYPFEVVLPDGLPIRASCLPTNCGASTGARVRPRSPASSRAPSYRK